jgi:hypothetical protein
MNISGIKVKLSRLLLNLNFAIQPQPGHPYLNPFD